MEEDTAQLEELYSSEYNALWKTYIINYEGSLAFIS